MAFWGILFLSSKASRSYWRVNKLLLLFLICISSMYHTYKIGFLTRPLIITSSKYWVGLYAHISVVCGRALSYMKMNWLPINYPKTTTCSFRISLVYLSAVSILLSIKTSYPFARQKKYRPTTKTDFRPRSSGNWKQNLDFSERIKLGTL